MKKMHIRTGSEGPTHDPYSYTEMEIETEHINIILHVGLVCWLRVEDKFPCEYVALLAEGDHAVDKWFEATGLTPAQFERAYWRVHGSTVHGQVVARTTRRVTGAFAPAPLMGVGA